MARQRASWASEPAMTSPSIALPRAPLSAAASTTWLGRSVLALATLALLWLVFNLYAAGQPLIAMGVLIFGATTLAIYGSARSLAWRYLFPGVAGMLIFEIGRAHV